MPAAEGDGRPRRPGSKFDVLIGDPIRDSGLVKAGDSGVVLVSGGADSVALLVGLTSILGPEGLVALHVNYGLREEADQDEQLVRDLCDRFGVELEVHRAGKVEGNLQAWAREIRLSEAERIRSERGLDWIAIGHNRTDQAETFLYRLASSPGVRPLLAMPPRSGRIIRPMLSLDRGLIRRLLEHAFPYAEDQSNNNTVYARNWIRHRLLADLSEVNPGAERNVVRTRTELEQDDEALTGLAAEALAGGAEVEGELDGRLLANQHPSVQRRMLRLLAEKELGRPVAITVELRSEVERLLADPEGGRLDLGGGDQFEMAGGRVRVLPGGGEGDDEIPAARGFDTGTGRVDFGDWEIRIGRTDEAAARSVFGNPWHAFFDESDLLMSFAESVPGVDAMPFELRSWQSGDRIEPLGMSGSKKLQDLFTDSLVPAPRRRTWPILTVGSKVIWVPGLARSRHLLIGGPDTPVIHLQATPPFPI